MAHADVDQANPPARRIGCVVLIRNRSGDVLMVKPTYKHADSKQGWQLPGGGAHQGEGIAAAAVREVKEETGLTVKVSHAVCIDQVPASEDGSSAEGVNLVCDGGTVLHEQAVTVTVPESARAELSEVRWVAMGELDELAFPYQVARVRNAVRAAEFGMRLPLYRLGEAASA
ncbi:NUDIX domain-containing protein [Streptomyces spectabilis]|nr:NUDIX hydrolase [Streptomyces spectabilis]MBB5103347.1 8-oxo-dGTP pyrophosphatase MutT (NUDIX family) [Streptomyces spectabilis]MCI3902537.1 NUDIX hydrolase [Streptomyces spectabilis]GGV54320.1 hypothetical protein GCM10010245_85870 [Streptomyces spectabilis]